MNLTKQIKLRADSDNFNSPVDAISNKPLRLHKGDDIKIDVLFFNKQFLADIQDVQKSVLEIIDIGERNSPLPREQKILLRIILEKESLNPTADESDWNNPHVSFILDKSQTSLPSGEKWLRIYCLDSNARRSTFTSGWIEIEENFGDFCEEENPPLKANILTKEEADLLYCTTTNNLSDIKDKVQARKNLDTISKEELETAITSHTHSQYALLSRLEEEIENHTHSDYEAALSLESEERKSADSINTQKLENIQKLSAQTGRFFFNGGTFQATQKQALGTTFSICRTLKIKWEDWETLADYRYFDGNNLGWGSNSTIGWGFAVISHRLFFYYRAIEGSTTILSLSTEQTKSIMNGNVHTLIVTAGNNIFSIYVDGRLIKSQTATQEIIEIPEPSYAQQIRQITGEYSRIKQFNFDMSASDAPYTIEDYCKGIEEPPSLHNPSAEYHTDYSYSDDVNLVQVKDNSGNNNHAFIYGSVMADKNKEPANITASVEFDKNAISALPIISTNANTIQKNQLITLKLKASISSNFNLGTLTDATYCGVVNLEANEWKSITIESSLDSPLILTPQSALQEKCKIKLILNYERII